MSKQLDKKNWTRAEIEEGERQRKEFMDNLQNEIPTNKDLKVVKLVQAFKNAKANGTLKVVKKINYVEIEGGIQLPDGTQILDGAQRRLANEMKTQQQKN
jgi:hypothetical protein